MPRHREVLRFANLRCQNSSCAAWGNHRHGNGSAAAKAPLFRGGVFHRNIYCTKTHWKIRKNGLKTLSITDMSRKKQIKHGKNALIGSVFSLFYLTLVNDNEVAFSSISQCSTLKACWLTWTVCVSMCQNQLQGGSSNGYKSTSLNWLRSKQ